MTRYYSKTRISRLYYCLLAYPSIQWGYCRNQKFKKQFLNLNLKNFDLLQKFNLSCLKNQETHKTMYSVWFVSEKSACAAKKNRSECFCIFASGFCDFFFLCIFKNLYWDFFVLTILNSCEVCVYMLRLICLVTLDYYEWVMKTEFY